MTSRMQGLWRAGLLCCSLLGSAAPLYSQTVLLSGPVPKMTAAQALALMRGPKADLEATLVRCCKTCSKGKACGDSCISRDKKCSKAAGCACNG